MIKFRWLSILCGLSIFIWSSTENVNLYIVTFLGMCVALLVTWFYFNKYTNHIHFLLGMIMQGGITGILTALLSSLLMLFKNVRHAHQSPDFPFEQIKDVLIRTPIWMVIGMLMGLSIGLLWLSKDAKGH